VPHTCATWWCLLYCDHRLAVLVLKCVSTLQCCSCKLCFIACCQVRTKLIEQMPKYTMINWTVQITFDQLFDVFVVKGRWFTYHGIYFVFISNENSLSKPTIVTVMSSYGDSWLTRNSCAPATKPLLTSVRVYRNQVNIPDTTQYNQVASTVTCCAVEESISAKLPTWVVR
jgi:hypothetical protein